MMDQSNTVAVLGPADVETLAEVICLGAFESSARAELEARKDPSYWEGLPEETRDGHRRAAVAVIGRFGIVPATKAQAGSAEAVALAYKARGFARWLRAGNAGDVRPDSEDYDELAAMIESFAVRGKVGAFTRDLMIDAQEIERYIAKCRELADDGQYQWWVRLADILEAVPRGIASNGPERA